MRRTFLLLVTLVLLLACASPPATGGGTSPPPLGASPGVTGPKRITVAFQGDVIGLDGRVRQTGPSIGGEPLQEMVNPGLAVADGAGNLHPVLAEVVPSLDNGMWKLLPDGGMQTTWTIKQGAHWHDGMPFTADDLAFT